VRAQFEVWGEVENVNVIVRLAVAFVRYRCRTSAEYALQSMANQSLGNGEVLNVRWAYDDPNPAAIAAREAADAAAVAAALLARGVRVHAPAGPAERPPPGDAGEAAAQLVPQLQDADGTIPDSLPHAEPGAPLAIVPPDAEETVTGSDVAAFLSQVPKPPPLASYASWGGAAGSGGLKRAREENEAS
jgi:hypothetical protein